MDEPAADPPASKKEKKYQIGNAKAVPLRKKLGSKKLKTADYGFGNDQSFQLEQRVRRDRARLRSDPGLLRERRRCMVGLIIAAAVQMLVLAVQTEMMYNLDADTGSRYTLSIRLSLLLACLLLGCVAIAGKKPFGGALIAATSYVTYLGVGWLIHLESSKATIIIQIVALLFVGRSVLFGRNYATLLRKLSSHLGAQQAAMAKEIEADKVEKAAPSDD